MPTIACLFASLLIAPVAHPPEAKHHHPTHNPPHTTSDDRSRFTTNRSSDVVLPLPGEEDAFFFVVFGDRTGGPASGVEILAQAVNETNLLEPDFVMTVGDLVEGYNNREQWTEQMREFTGIMNRLLCPWFPVAGNHDIYWRGAGRPREEHEGDYETHFGPLWYAFEHKNAWFIALYSDEANPETGERNFNKPECQRMSDEQFSWLKETLAKAKDAEHVFVFLHHPRWLGGRYGDDWEKVHKALADAGNVTAVFAGHIHQMRYDGPRDGIEYVTLATVGGGQEGASPEAGYLHQFHIVTVRQGRIALASIPVGEVMDVRAITGQVNEETGRLARERPAFETSLPVSSDGSAEGVLRVTLSNPVSRPIEATLAPGSMDSRWIFAPDHAHRQIAPGESFTFEIHAARAPAPLDETWRFPQITLDVDYLAPAARFAIATKTIEVPLDVELAPPPVPAVEQALSLDGRSAVAAVPSEALDVPDGPLTLECWLLGENFRGRRGLVAKTENSDYGIFVSEGVPSFSIFLGDRYAEARAEDSILTPGQWHHVAGIYDGREVRLYVDGRLIATTPRSGPRRTNHFPLIVGADVDGNGNPMSWFEGQIDAVRLSTVARYAGQSFTPQRRFERDADTALLLNMDGEVGTWLFDESGHEAHPRLRGGAGVRAATQE